MDNKKPKNTAAIICLIICFPVGLYLMWAKTNWKKSVKITITILISLTAIIALMTPSDSETPEKTTSTTKITTTAKSSIKFGMGYSDTIELELNGYTESKNTYFTVHSDDKIDIDTIKFVSENPEIATFTYDNTVADRYIYYNVEAVGVGETYIYVQTTDGTVTSDKIKVVVTESETTTEETTIGTTRETSPETTTQEDVAEHNGITVYITPTGKKYHYSRSCAGENAMERDLDDVEGSYEPCKKCAS